MKFIKSFLALAIMITMAAPFTAFAMSPVTSPAKATNDIVTIAINNGNFTTLVSAVLCANPAVVSTLTSGEQYTVFAPTDAAFAKLGLNSSNICTVLDQSTLTNVLLYHVADGRRFSNSVLPKNEDQTRMIETLLGSAFEVSNTGEIIDVDSNSMPKIVMPNIPATNGVIHVVDEVLLPIEL
jgi:uncharacterized surface protein with fasciclin (FAS1) repeats